MRRVGYPVIDTMISVAIRPIRDALELLQPQLDTGSIRLRRIDSSPWPAPGSASQLEQLFLNLCLNAFAAMDTHNEFTVRVADLSDGDDSTLLVERTRVPA